MTDAAPIDYYNLLGNVGPASTNEELRRAYHKRAVLVHPDKNLDDPEAKVIFQQLTEAYEFLKNAQNRKQYDQQFLAKQALIERRRTEDVRMKAMREALERRERLAAQQAKLKNQPSKQVEEQQIRKENQEYMATLRARVLKKRETQGELHSSQSLHAVQLKKLAQENNSTIRNILDRPKAQYEPQQSFSLEEYEQYIFTKINANISAAHSPSSTLEDIDNNFEDPLNLSINSQSSVVFIDSEIDSPSPTSPESGKAA